MRLLRCWLSLIFPFPHTAFILACVVVFFGWTFLQTLPGEGSMYQDLYVIFAGALATTRVHDPYRPCRPVRR